MIGESDIAALVRAFLFQLVQASTGLIVAELTSSIPAGGIPPYDMVGLLMHHLEPGPAGAWWSEPGHLAWSAPNDRDNYPVVRLSGAADQLGNAAYLMADNTGATGSPATSATLAASGADGTNSRSAEVRVASQDSGVEASVSLTALADSAAHAFSTLTVTPTGLTLETFATSRNAYMMTGYGYDGLWGANITLTTAGVNLNASVTFGDCITGDVIFLFAYFALKANTYSAGVISIGRIFVNGANIGPECYHNPSASGQGATVPLVIPYAIPADGSYTFDLYGYKSAAGGSYIASYHTALIAQRMSRQ